MIGEVGLSLIHSDVANNRNAQKREANQGGGKSGLTFAVNN